MILSATDPEKDWHGWMSSWDWPVRPSSVMQFYNEFQEKATGLAALVKLGATKELDSLREGKWNGPWAAALAAKLHLEKEVSGIVEPNHGNGLLVMSYVFGAEQNIEQTNTHLKLTFIPGYVHTPLIVRFGVLHSDEQWLL